MSRFGALLRRLRLDTGMTQQQLEERSGVSVRAISRLEAGHGGNPRVNTVRLLADALPLEPDEREELLATATGAVRRETGGGLVPQQLPAPPGVFVGRCDALAALDEAAMISTISGGGGMGKTWLALHWAHRNMDRFPDGQLFLDLHGHGGEPVDPAEAVRGLLDALGVEESAVPAGLAARTALYRSLTTGKQMLILLDDASDTAQVSPLLPGSPSCTVIVTSRDNLAGLVAVHGASPIALDVMNATDARHVLTRRLGRQRLAAEPVAVGDILACCGGLPLALGVVAARAALRPGVLLAEVAAELRDEVGRLDTANPDPDRPLNSHRLDGVPVPRQLPSAIRDFTGRAEPLATLDTLVATTSDSNSAVVTGTAGVGKTALAVHWAHRVQHRFPDGTLYINLRGYGPDEPATPGDVLGVFLGALGMLPERIPVDLDARVGLYRSVLAGRRVLIVLDNANSATQVRPLLPGGAGCAVVVTSRADLAGLVIGDGATRVPVDLLAEREALRLVRATIGPRRADAQPGAVAGLVRACARLPLALRIAAGRAAAQPHMAIADLVSELDSEQGRWAALRADEDTAVRVVFDWSYHRLTSEQARMLRRLGLHPGPEFSVHAAAAVAGLDVAAARPLLDALAEAHLIEPVARDRYRFHDLLRAYAADRADHDDAPAERDQARHTVLEWYAHHGKNAYLAIAPRLFDWLAGADVDTRACPEIPFPGPAEAWAWVDAELVTMAASVRAAARHGLPRFTIVMASTAIAAVSLQGLWDDLFDVCDIGLAAARHAGDSTAECKLLISRACALQCVGRWREAIDCVRAAVALAQDLGDAGLQAVALSHLGWMFVEQQQYTDASEHFRSALPLSAGVQDGYLEGFIEYSLDAIASDPGPRDGDIHRAVSCWRVALETFDKVTDPRTVELRTRIYALAETRRLTGLLSPAVRG